MRLVEIEIEGFKSFGKYTRIRLAEGITAIVGPNGSGKSNVVDAIRWAFGSHSHKDLRTPKKEDVFFAGSPTLPPATRAMVALTFELENGDLMTISREMTRDGKNFYRINGENVRLKDVIDRFSGTGVGKEFYSIIAQGQVERIVNSSAEELRMLVEEAANISKFRMKKKETLRKIEETRVNLNRVEDLMTELEREMRSLYLKAKRAEKYKEYSEELRKLKKRYFSDRINYLRRKLLDYGNSMDLNKSKLKEIFREMADVENKLSNLREEFGEVDKEIERMTKIIEDYRSRETSLRELRNRYSSELKELESAYLNRTMELNSLEKSMEDGEKRISELEMIVSSIRGKMENLESELVKLRNERDEIYSAYSEKEKEAMRMRERMELLSRKKMKLENERFKLDETMKDLESRMKMVEEQLKVKISRYEELGKEFDELIELSREVGKREEKLKEKSMELKSRISEMKGMMDSLNSKFRDLMDEKNRRISKLEVLRKEFEEYSGFSESVRRIFEWKENGEVDGVIDVVVNIMEVDEKYSKSIDALLGSRSNYIVVESGEDAVNILELLKTRKVGRVAFLPLDLMNEGGGRKRKNDGIDGMTGFVGYAKDLVKVEEKFQKVVDYLFGDSIVVERIEDAVRLRKMGYRMRMVSLDGDLLERGGAISGGYSVNGNSMLVKKSEMRRMEDDVKKLEKEIEELLNQRKKLGRKLEKLREEKEKIDQELADSLLKNESVRRTMEDLRKNMEEMKKEISNLTKLKKDYELKMEGYRGRLERIGREEEEIDSELVELERRVQQFDDTLKERRRILQELESEIMELNLALENEKEKLENYLRELEELRNNLEGWSIRVEDIKHEIESLDRKMNERRESIEELDAELRSLKKEIDDLFEGMKFRREGKEQKVRDMEKLEKRLEELKNEADNLRDTVHNMELEMKEIQAKYQNMYDEVIKSGITLEELDDNLILDETERDELSTRIDDLERKLRFLGNVDLDSIEEYREVERRYGELREQRNDLLKAIKSLNEIMEKTEEEAKRVFLQTFGKVSENFSKMVADLFEGAMGEMRLNYSDNPLDGGIEIIIKKMGKREEKLNLLSGGEKSLVGLALLFSLLNINPSPFYILDEVDAALDDYNAERLKRTLLNYSKRTQFIIVTHNKLVMEGASKLYGITMSDGISTVVSVEYEKLKEKTEVTV